MTIFNRSVNLDILKPASPYNFSQKYLHPQIPVNLCVSFFFLFLCFFFLLCNNTLAPILLNLLTICSWVWGYMLDPGHPTRSHTVKLNWLYSFSWKSIWGPCSVLCSEALWISMIFADTWSHLDFSRQFYPKKFMWISMVCAATWSYVNVHRSCSYHRPCGCSSIVLLYKSMWVSVAGYFIALWKLIPC